MVMLTYRHVGNMCQYCIHATPYTPGSFICGASLDCLTARSAHLVSPNAGSSLCVCAFIIWDYWDSDTEVTEHQMRLPKYLPVSDLSKETL